MIENWVRNITSKLNNGLNFFAQMLCSSVMIFVLFCSHYLHSSITYKIVSIGAVSVTPQWWVTVWPRVQILEVFGSLVQSGLLTPPGMDWDRDWSFKLGNRKKPDWTSVDRSFVVFCGLKTWLGPVFCTILNRH